MPKDVYLCFICWAKTFDNLRHIVTEKKKIIYLGNISQYYRGITDRKLPEQKFTNNVLYKSKGRKKGGLFSHRICLIFTAR